MEEKGARGCFLRTGCTVKPGNTVKQLRNRNTDFLISKKFDF